MPRSKIFCVGLHKAGTTSLHALFKSLGLRSTHSTRWSRAPLESKVLDRFDAFSDGGRHFWNEAHEFGGNHELRGLTERHPDARFILQFREMRPWLVSKMLHAGWTRDTRPVDGPVDLVHEAWTVKSVHAIHGWIRNRLRYHEAACRYLASVPNDVLVVDVTRDADAATKVAEFALPTASLVVRDPFTIVHRAVNHVSPRFVPSRFPRSNVAGNDPQDREACREFLEEAIAEMPDFHDDSLEEIRAAVGRTG